MKLLKNTILIVDDDADDREAIREAFLESKHEGNYALMENADNLLKHLSENEQPALIMLDLNMPGKDGRDVLKELKKHEYHHPIPVVVLTTSSSAGDREASYKLGANCFVTKPNTFSELVDITRSIGKLWLTE